jgi:hypothetical protein
LFPQHPSANPPEHPAKHPAVNGEAEILTRPASADRAADMTQPTLEYQQIRAGR